MNETVKRIENAFKKNKKTVFINGMFLIDLEDMKQKDKKTGNSIVKRVRRTTQKRKQNVVNWFYEFKEQNKPSRFTLDHYFPMSVRDCINLENEYQKSIEDRGIIYIGYHFSFMADVTEMIQMGQYNDRKLIRIE